jgi:cytochrome c553
LICLAALLPAAALANPDRINEIITGNCALCHGLEGESASPVFPRLAAQHPEYMTKQLKDFRDGRRKATTMNSMAAELKNDEIVALANYYAKKKAAPHALAEPDLAAVGRYIYEKGNKFTAVPSCASCHGANGYGTAQLPRLAGQNAQYLETQMKEFNQRVRTNDNAVMHTIAAKLSELETAAVAQFMSGLD